MKCEEYEPVLVDLAAGELDGPAERELRAHLAECESCRQALREIEALFERAKNEFAATPPETLIWKVRAPARRGRKRSLTWRVPLWAAAAGMLLAAFVGAALGYSKGRGQIRIAQRQVTVVADSGPDFWRVSPEVLAQLRSDARVRPQNEFWNYRTRLDEFREGT